MPQIASRAVDSGRARIGAAVAGETMSTVRSVTVDGFAGEAGLERLDLVKIDVEGAEAFVLEGMDEVLDRYAPVVMLEVHPQWQPANYSVEWLMERMKKHGYHDRELCNQPLARRILWRRG